MEFVFIFLTIIRTGVVTSILRVFYRLHRLESRKRKFVSKFQKLFKPKEPKCTFKSYHNILSINLQWNCSKKLKCFISIQIFCVLEENQIRNFDYSKLRNYEKPFYLFKTHPSFHHLSSIEIHLVYDKILCLTLNINGVCYHIHMLSVFFLNLYIKQGSFQVHVIDEYNYLIFFSSFNVLLNTETMFAQKLVQDYSVIRCPKTRNLIELQLIPRTKETSRHWAKFFWIYSINFKFIKSTSIVRGLLKTLIL